MWLCCNHVAAVLKQSQYGRIINMASTLGLVGLAKRTPSATSKGAVVQMTRALGLEFALDKIRVNAICPGPFLLADTPLGQGSFDLKKMMNILRKKKPKLKFSLEVITRDTLKVPFLEDGYWESVAEASGSDLARSLRFVRNHSAKGQTINTLPLAKQVEIEDANIAASLKYASQELARRLGVLRAKSDQGFNRLQ